MAHVPRFTSRSAADGIFCGRRSSHRQAQQQLLKARSRSPHQAKPRHAEIHSKANLKTRSITAPEPYFSATSSSHDGLKSPPLWLARSAQLNSIWSRAGRAQVALASIYDDSSTLHVFDDARSMSGRVLTPRGRSSVLFPYGRWRSLLELPGTAPPT